MPGQTSIKETMARDTKNLRALENDALVVLAQDDNAQKARPALEELVRRHQKMVYIALYHLAPKRNDLQDMTQDVLLRMCRSIKTLRNPKIFKYWLNRIIKNLFYDALRKKPRQLNTVSMDAPYRAGDDEGSQGTRDIADESRRPEELAVSTELDANIQNAITSLPEHFRTIIVLREIQGLSYEEIASLTNSNLGTVKSRLARARGKLQDALQPYLNENEAE